VELANGIANYTGYQSYLLAEKGIPSRLKEHISPLVNVVENCFLDPDNFYLSDSIIVVNTDAKDFSTEDYWIGKSPRHNFSIDLHKLKGKTMCFLYNFLVSPSRHLCSLEKFGIKLKIITTNNNFFNEITKQDRYENIRIIPRYILESPIDQNKLHIRLREPVDEICFGAHSKRLGNKWNDELHKLVKDVNDRYSLIESKTSRENMKVKFRFMGMKSDLKKKMEKLENVVIMDEDAEPVRDFINQLDVFLFFPDWKREEPWARVIAEAMVSGCPVIALNKGGTPDQILNYNNGILCKNYKDYYKAVISFIEHKELIPKMSENSLSISKSFYSEAVIKKLINILNR
jgi:glycosyltransferase involved in cell wall biosynthesis